MAHVRAATTDLEATMWVSGSRMSDSTTCARGRAHNLVALPLASVLVTALAACSAHNASKASGVPPPASSSSVFFVPGSPTVYAGAYLAPDMHALLEWTRTGSIAAGTIELTGNPQPITVVGPGTYPLSLSFEGSSFKGSIEVSGQPVPISGQVTAAGVDLEFTDSPAMNPTLNFTSIGPGGYSYPPSYPAG